MVQSLVPSPPVNVFPRTGPPPSIEPLRLPAGPMVKKSVNSPPIRVPTFENVLTPSWLGLVNVPALCPVMSHTLGQSAAWRAFSPEPPSNVSVASHGSSSSSSSLSSGSSGSCGSGGGGGGGGG